jgi:tetratricopeptide (TPR) repeat protein
MLKALPAVDRATVSSLRHQQNGVGGGAAAAADWPGAGAGAAARRLRDSGASPPVRALVRAGAGAGAGAGGGGLSRHVFSGFVRLEALDGSAAGSSDGSASSSGRAARASNGGARTANGSSTEQRSSSSSSGGEAGSQRRQQPAADEALPDPAPGSGAAADAPPSLPSISRGVPKASSRNLTAPSFLLRPSRAPAPAMPPDQAPEQQADASGAPHLLPGPHLPPAAAATASLDELDVLAAWQQLEQAQPAAAGLQLEATTELPLSDASGRPLPSPRIPIPQLGCLQVSNSSRAYPGTDVLVDYETAGYDRLCMRLEYVTERSTGHTALCLWNRSRYVRGRLQQTVLLVNGRAVRPFSEAVALQPGDELCLGEAHVSFRVRAVPAGEALPSPAMVALQKYCGDVDLSQVLTGGGGGGGGSLAMSSNIEEEEAALAAGSFSVPGPLDARLYKLYRGLRQSPQEADQQLRALAVAQPDNAGVWWVWAQAAAALRRPAMARDLLRAAAHCCCGAAAAQRLRRQREQLELREAILRGGSGAAAGPGPGADGAGAGAGSGPDGEGAARWSGRLAQVLATWAALEWDLKQFGSARRLWRAAADEALLQQRQRRLPPGAPMLGGLLHTWATREYERDNVRNARVVVTEALRKCPDDAGLYVLAAGIESKAGNRQLAQTLYMDAFRLNKGDKHLYLGWPRLEAELGNPERARALFEKGLALHPYNTKIMNAFACFEAEHGAHDAARELHRRALALDGSSATTMHNRVSWAAMEAGLGRLEAARQLLLEALDLHPDFQAALVTLCSVERKAGRLEVAEALARRALRLSCGHHLPAAKELQLLFEARGEPALAANSRRHVGAVSGMLEMKRGGAWGSEAWQKYYQRTETPAARATAAAARRRKQQLGLVRKRQYEPRPGRGVAAEAAAEGGGPDVQLVQGQEADEAVAAAAYYGLRSLQASEEEEEEDAGLERDWAGEHEDEQEEEGLEGDEAEFGVAVGSELSS